jgi:hypothetical protein
VPGRVTSGSVQTICCGSNRFSFLSSSLLIGRQQYAYTCYEINIYKQSLRLAIKQLRLKVTPEKWAQVCG